MTSGIWFMHMYKMNKMPYVQVVNNLSIGKEFGDFCMIKIIIKCTFGIYKYFYKAWDQERLTLI